MFFLPVIQKSKSGFCNIFKVSRSNFQRAAYRHDICQQKLPDQSFWGQNFTQKRVKQNDGKFATKQRKFTQNVSKFTQFV